MTILDVMLQGFVFVGVRMRLHEKNTEECCDRRWPSWNIKCIGLAKVCQKVTVIERHSTFGNQGATIGIKPKHL
jgi:hypothetical protein